MLCPDISRDTAASIADFARGARTGSRRGEGPYRPSGTFRASGFPVLRGPRESFSE